MLTTLLLAAAVSATTHLVIEPWRGSNLPTVTSSAQKYRLRVTGTPNATLVLHAGDLAKGWLAAFCTPRVCAPMRVDVTLPATGAAVYQFELIREETGGPAHSGATITSSDGASVSVPH